MGQRFEPGRAVLACRIVETDEFARWVSPRTYAPPDFVKDENGRGLIPLTAAEARRLFNRHVRAAHPDDFHRRWSDWRRRRQAAARKSHCTRRLKDQGRLPWY